MARKLIAVAALMALVSLASAGAVLAETYELNGGYDTRTPFVTYVEMYGDTGSGNPNRVPGTALGEFEGCYEELTNFTDWKIARSENTEPGEIKGETDNTITYEVTYNQLMTGHGIGDTGDGRFRVDTTEISFTSYDFVPITTATYNKTPQGTQNDWLCYSETIYGEGHYYDNGTEYFFTLSGSLYINTYNSSTHTGYFMEPPFSQQPLTLDVNPVPLPAGIWLLGTGLLGLACLGRRRRK